MSLLKTNEIQNYNGSSLTLTASTVSTSAQLNTGGNISVTGSLNVSDDSTTRTNLGLGTIATQDSDSITVTGGTATLGALTVSGSDSGDLVRITQTGSGYALVVEDSANPDSTPFVVDGNGNLLVGRTTVDSQSIVGHQLDADGYAIHVSDNDPAGFFGRNSTDGAIIDLRRDGTNVGSIGSSGGELYIGSTSYGVTSGIIFAPNKVLPTTGAGTGADNSNDLGQSNVRWNEIYLANGAVSGSDKNEKVEITNSDLGLNFIKRVNPVSYKWIGRYRTHYGMISQEIETLLSDVGKTSLDFAGFIKSPVTDDDGNETGEYRYGLRYAEFISPMIKAIQEQQTIIESQQSQIDALTARIVALETT